MRRFFSFCKLQISSWCLSASGAIYFVCGCTTKNWLGKYLKPSNRAGINCFLLPNLIRSVSRPSQRTGILRRRVNQRLSNVPVRFMARKHTVLCILYVLNILVANEIRSNLSNLTMNIQRSIYNYPSSKNMQQNWWFIRSNPFFLKKKKFIIYTLR